jgi:AraC-like DNA-binding protein
LNGSDTGASVSSYRERRPAVPHPLVACRWEQTIADDAEGYVQRVLPDACADVIVSSGGTAVVVGSAGSAQLTRLAPGERLRGLRFRSSAIGTALGLPAHELRDLEVPLRDVFPAEVAGRITDEVWRGTGPTSLDPAAPDRRVEHALAALARPASRVAAVAGELEMSERHLRRLVLAHTGLEPSVFQRIARFQRFLTLADGDARSLADLATRAGYADQAHLSRETRTLSGLTPAALLGEWGPSA